MKKLPHIFMIYSAIFLLFSCKQDNDQNKMASDKLNLPKKDIVAEEQLVIPDESIKDISSDSIHTNKKEIEYSGIGIALHDSVFVYTDSSLDAAIVDTLYLAEARHVLGERSNGKLTFAYNGWFKVRNSQDRPGWVAGEGLAVDYGKSCLSLPRMPNISITEAYYNMLLDYLDYAVSNPVCSNYSEVAYKDKEALILAILEKLEPIVPSDDVVIFYTQHDYFLRVGTGVLIPYVRSQVYLNKRQYHKAIAELRKIMNREEQQELFYGNSKPEAAYLIADIYYKYLQDYQKANEMYHFLISQYPGAVRGPREWAESYSDFAARRILEPIFHMPDSLLKVADRIISGSKDHLRIYAYVCKVEALGKKRQMRQMIDTALSVILQIPEGIGVFPERQIEEVVDEKDIGEPYVSYEVVSRAFSYLEIESDTSLFMDFANTLQTRLKSYPIAAIAALRVAQFADKTDADVETIKKLYTKVVENFEETRFFDDEYEEYLNTNLAKTLLEELAKSVTLSAETTNNVTVVRKGMEWKFPVIAKLPPGTRLKILYTNGTQQRENCCAKVQLENGTIGWINRNILRVLDDNRGG